MSRWFALLLIALLPAIAPAAPLDPETGTEYSLRIVCRFASHPLLTPDFRRETLREIQGQVGLALGPLGKVETRELDAIADDQRTPLEALFAKDGFAVLETYNRISTAKTHFVQIDFQEGRYDVQARGHDGMTGLAGPTLRRQGTFERSLVARLCSLMVMQDFGWVGTVDDASYQPQLGTVVMQLKAGQLGQPMNAWVRKGDSFMLSQIRQITKRGTATTPSTSETVGNRMTDVYLVAQEDAKGDRVPCKIIQRYASNAMPKHASIQGYRGLKLGTITTPVRVQLVDATGRPIRSPDLRVRVLESGFEEGNVPASDRDEAPLVNGVFTTKRPYSHMAYVKVQVGPEVRAQIPLALLDERVVTALFRLDANADRRARFLLARNDFQKRIYESLVVQSRIFEDLIIRERKGDNRAALKLAESTLQALKDDAINFTSEIDQLRTRAEKDAPAEVVTLAPSEQQIQRLREKLGDLQQHIDQLKIVIGQEDNPAITEKNKALQAKLREAELRRKQGDYDKALSLYDELLEMNDNPMVRERRDQLAAAWKEKDEEHGKARKFIGVTMPALTTLDEIRAQVPEMKKVVAKFKSLNDRLGFVKMEAAFTQLATRMDEQIQPLLEPMDDEGRKALEAAQMLIKEVREVLNEVSTYLREHPAE